MSRVDLTELVLGDITERDVDVVVFEVAAR
ncbi:hypothetical protein CLV71_10879 [Actinophytocola oryzae]|uniref:Uncharacterized protein n=1 Tax=Actinophytocola oryzae TaxID=502181 RepID=A0A4R7VHZ5_9PSEU|nr:hypothetical protein CLV71_10879 [Actinophytocola oryzae]